MKLYPYTRAFIINDNVFQSYGGQLANTSTEARKAAYWMAEEAVTQDLGTFLQPTTVTGTYQYSHSLVLDYGYVNTVYSVKFRDFNDSVIYEFSGLGNWNAAIRDRVRGILDLNYCAGVCGCVNPYSYQIEVAYNAGLPTGTSVMPNVLLALTTYSQIILNEIMGFGNEAPGDIGIEDYQNQDYRENRIGLFRTVYGSSPKALFVHRLLTDLREYKQVGL